MRKRLGEAFVRKIVKVMDLAAKNGAPLVGIYDWRAVVRGATGA